MSEGQIMQVLQRVADRNGVPLTTVLKEIDRVIDGGMDSPNPQIRVRWKKDSLQGCKADCCGTDGIPYGQDDGSGVPCMNQNSYLQGMPPPTDAF